MSAAKPEGYDSVAVANQFILIAKKAGKPLCSLTKLVKLVYIAHGCYLALRDKVLIRDDIEAWRYGPVIPRVYRTFRRMPPVAEPLEISLQTDEKLAADDARLVESVHGSYGRFHYTDLSELTHKKGTPWDIVYRNDGVKGKIDNDLIKDYYYDLIENSRQS